MDEAALLIAAMLAAGTPLAIAGLGLLINEKVGVLNLGAEGMMLIGAMAGFACAFWSANPWVGLLGGAAAGMLLAALFGALTVFLLTNQYATGLAVTLFGAGLAAFMGTGFVEERLDIANSMTCAALAQVPFAGAFFKLNPMVYITIALAVLIGCFFYRTRMGLVMRAVGESPESAHALGYPVRTIRMLGVMVGGALCGLAGAYISVVYASMWNEGMTAGRGWIALALTSFATWRPARVLLGAYLFGGVTMLQFYLQAQGVDLVSPFVMNMLPYVATIVVLVLISRKPEWIRVNMPVSLGKPFYPGG